MEMNRRDLLLRGAAGAAALTAGAASIDATPAHAAPAQARPKARLRISSQEGIIPGKNLQEKLEKMQAWGFDGIEFGGGGLAGRVKEIQNALKDSPLKISAICAGFQGALSSDQESERKKAVDTMTEIITAAGELGSTGLIYVPAFNGQTKLNHVDARKALLDNLPGLGDYAAKCGTRVLLEPLNRGETWLVRLLADATAISRDAKSPGACVMGDFYHMCIEEPSDMGGFISAGKLLHHVHLASRKRNLPGQDDRDFTDGFRGLKMIGYQDFCSFECGVVGDREVEIAKSVKFLREQWAKA